MAFCHCCVLLQNHPCLPIQNIMVLLITGGCGFIGSHVALECLRNGVGDMWPIVLLDEHPFLNGIRPPMMENTEKIAFEQCSLLDRPTLQQVFAKYRPSIVCHMAAKIEVEESQRRPDIYYRHNVVGTQNLLDVMMENNCKRLVFSSTAALYGEVSATAPLKEAETEKAYHLIGSVYGRTKRHCEDMIADYARAFALKAIVFRYFNAAGATPSEWLGENREHETHLIPVVLMRLLQGKDVFIFGDSYPTRDGTCVRDYVHVQDLAAAHRLGLEKLLRDDNLVQAGQPQELVATLNLGSATGLTVKEVMDEMRKVTAREDMAVKIAPPRPGDVPVLVADSAAARTALGWTCQKTLTDIVADTWAWMQLLSQHVKQQQQQ